MSAITGETIKKWFTYHPPTGTQQQRYSEVNAMCEDFAELILNVCEEGDDRDAALRALRRLRMDVNLTIACEAKAPT